MEIRLRALAIALLATLAIPPAAALGGVGVEAAGDVDARVDADLDYGVPPAPAAPDPAAIALPAIEAPAGADGLLALAPIDAAVAADGGALVDVGASAATGGEAATASSAAAAAVADVASKPAGRAALGAAAYAAVQLLRVALIGLFARIGQTELLDNKQRDAVYRAIREDPGVSVTELQERLGIGWGALQYHLDRLERGGFVGSQRVGLARRCFAVGETDVRIRAGIGLLKRPALRELAQHVTAHPGLTQGEVASALGLSPSAMAKQIAQLEEAKLVERVREGKVAYVLPTPELAALLPAAEPAIEAPTVPAPSAPAFGAPVAV